MEDERLRKCAILDGSATVKFLENHTITCVSAGWNHSGFATGLQILKLFISYCGRLYIESFLCLKCSI